MQLEGLVIPISFDTGMLLKGVSMITGLIEGAVSATFEWADGMDRLGDVTGMTTEQTAAWAFVAKKAGVEVDTLSNATVILAKGLFDSTGKLSTTGQALENFGVSVTDVNGEVKDQATLMDDIAEKYATLGTQTEKVDFLTNVFGKSGANLIDVFDTLAQEGGIDAVTQKVKDFGLAIDPARYEQFQRNLNELKLVAMGVGVQFTEALMPALESVMTWAQQFAGMSPGEILARLGDMAEGLPDKLLTLAKSFETWTQGIDWSKTSADLIAGIDSIDWNTIGLALGTAISGLGNVFNGMDWSGLFSSLGAAFMEFSTGIVGGSLDEFTNSWNFAFEQIAIYASGKMDEVRGGISAALGGLAGGEIATFIATWQTIWTSAATVVKTATENISKALQVLPAKVSTTFALIVVKLKEALEKMKEILLAIGEAIAAAVGGVSLGTAGAGVDTTTKKQGKAAGGNASGLTWVGENGPELVNLPTGSYVNNNQTSNRMNSGPTQAYIDYDELARTMARVLGQQMQRAA